MFKPLEAARADGKFRSLDELAKRLSNDTALPWPKPRALAVKIGDIDRGDLVWWTRRKAHADALAELLDVPPADLGLHDAPTGDVFEFATFPELPPIALAREACCDIGFVESASERDSSAPLAFWLDATPPRHAWQGPEHRISWLQFQPGAGLRFYRAALGARTRHDHLSTRRLLDANTRLREPGNLILHIEQPCDDADLLALGGMHPDLNILILAAFGAPTQADESAATSWLPAWRVLTGNADKRTAALHNPFDGLIEYRWRLYDDWQSRLLAWVESRISRASIDTLLTASGVANWLASFPSGWQFVNGPADLLAVCRLCHLSPETALPRVSDTDAGQRLLKRVTRADSALSRRFTALVTARLDARELPWRGALPATQWESLTPALTSVPDEAVLLEIANAANIAARRERARTLSKRIRDTGLAPLIAARLLVSTQVDTLALAPQFLVDLVARDHLMQVIRDEPVQHWARYCHDAERRLLVDAALGSMPSAELLIVLERLKTVPATSLAGIAGAEAMFRDIGKRLCATAPVPTAFDCLADMVLPRLAADGFLPQPWTRPEGEPDEELEWVAICWAWSLRRPLPPIELPEHWAWYFPGWALQGIEQEIPLLWTIGQPEGHVLSCNWQRMTALATQLARKLARPPAYPPDFLQPMLLLEALRGRWPADVAWVEHVLGHAAPLLSTPVENVVHAEIVQIGPAAAARLLPALMEFLLVDPGDIIRRSLLQRSPIRTWALQNISFDEAASCLTERQLDALWWAPHTLPPHLLEGLLRDPDAVPPALLPAREQAVGALDADHIDILSGLLATASLGELAAERLWRVAPEVAEHFLRATPDATPPAVLRWLILNAPHQKTGPVARAILTQEGLLSAEELTYWARSRLPSAGAHADALGRILGLDSDDQHVAHPRLT